MHRLLERDRAERVAESDFPAPLEEHVRRLHAAGFGRVQPFFQEHRIFGVLAQKAQAVI